MEKLNKQSERLMIPAPIQSNRRSAASFFGGSDGMKKVPIIMMNIAITAMRNNCLATNVYLSSARLHSTSGYSRSITGKEPTKDLSEGGTKGISYTQNGKRDGPPRFLSEGDSHDPER